MRIVCAVLEKKEKEASGKAQERGGKEHKEFMRAPTSVPER